MVLVYVTLYSMALVVAIDILHVQNQSQWLAHYYKPILPLPNLHLFVVLVYLSHKSCDILKCAFLILNPVSLKDLDSSSCR